MNPDELDTSGTLDALGQMAMFGKTAVALVVVVGLIFLLSHFLRRFNLGSLNAGKIIKQIAVHALSPREKIVVIQVQDKWLVLGVSSGQMNCLSEMDIPENMDTDSEKQFAEPGRTGKSSFAETLLKTIKSGSANTNPREGK